MIQCYAGDAVHRDTPLVERVERETVMRGVDTAVDVGLDGLWAPDHIMLGPHKEEYEVWTQLATLTELHPKRVFLGLGTGEAMDLATASDRCVRPSSRRSSARTATPRSRRDLGGRHSCSRQSGLCLGNVQRQRERCL